MALGTLWLLTQIGCGLSRTSVLGRVGVVRRPAGAPVPFFRTRAVRHPVVPMDTPCGWFACGQRILPMDWARGDESARSPEGQVGAGFGDWKWGGP
ncbi:hypothetical protein GCM10027030_25160 [Luteococcus sediminum]